MAAPTHRFSDRVENYIRYRPSYPEEIVKLLEKKAHLTEASSIADIGSGTGISAEIMLKHDFAVTGVEPNDAMRQAAEKRLESYPRFTSIPATAQATTLADHSVDLIIAAQAFHWFSGKETREEFSRILKPGGLIALLWNVRQVDTTPFLKAYEALLLEYGTDYNTVRHETINSDVLGAFFIGDYELHTFHNQQIFDYEALEGRLLSSSYVPLPGQPRHQDMIHALKELFHLYQEHGTVTIDYITEVNLGK